MSKKTQKRRPEAADDGPWIDPKDAPPRLILMAPTSIDPAFMAGLDLLLGQTRPAAFILSEAALPGEDREQEMAAIRSACHGSETAFLLSGDPVQAIALGADGMEIEGADGLLRARHVLGAERLLGAACGLSRHEAMNAGEAGADFVRLGALDSHPSVEELAELASWWSELFVLPVAIAAPAELAAITEIAVAGADFIVLGGSLWQKPEPASFLADIARALAAITRTDP